MTQILTLQDIPRVKAGCSAKRDIKNLGELDQERLYLATRAKDVLGYSGMIADVTGELGDTVKSGKLGEALRGLEIDVLDLGKVLDYQMQEMIRATREKIVQDLHSWTAGYFLEAGWQHTELASYSMPVPEFVLDKAIKIKEAVPAVTFYVQHLRDPKADPFLIAVLNKEIYYVEAWDEPRFEGRLR